MPELVRWNDDRLDDLAREVHQQDLRLEAQSELRVQMAEMRRDIKAAKTDAHACRAELAELKNKQEARTVEQHKERKADRKWMVLTGLTTAGLVISALAVFL